MEQQLDPSGSAMLKTAMEGMGNSVMLGAAATEMQGAARLEGLAFKDGAQIGCDLLVVCDAAGVSALAGAACGRDDGRTTIMCPSHDRTYDLRTGKVLVGECSLVTYPARVEAGVMKVEV